MSSAPNQPYNIIGGVVTHPEDADRYVQVQNGWLLANYIPTMYPYDYDYFHNRLETEVINSLSGIPSPPNGDGVYEISQPTLVLSDTLAFDNRNIVLFVDGDVLVTSPNFTPANGATLFIVRGTISFDPAVTQARGIFLANELISTGTSSTNSLAVTGMLLSYGGINLERNVGQGSPSESIIHDYGIAIQLRDLLWKNPVAFGETIP